MIDPMTKLTEHFTLGEMCRSERHPKIYNVPPLEKVDNIKLVCEWLERLRALYGRRYNDGKDTPLYVNSGYRSAQLNHAVGGAPRSNHLNGCAADIRCPGKDAVERGIMALRYATLLLEMFQFERKAWDEIIIERKGTNWWVHFAVKPSGNGRYLTVINKTR